jgi:hypothetical protein
MAERPDALERDLADDTADPLGPHRYLSTACRHQLHDRCREVCKFCDAPCICSHHQADERR